ncbi:MAG: hypothetical protein QXP80_00390 [Zestosphaera sp.]
MDTRKLMSISALTILVLALGSALAMWSEELRINATVETGEVDVKWSDWWCSDEGPDPQAEGFRNDEGKDVASCLVEVELEDDEGDPIKLLVTLDNAYPGYSVDVYLIVDNIGTIPVKLYSATIEIDPEAPIEAWFMIPEDTQIDPGGTGEYILHIEVLQEAEENTTYEGVFEAILVFAQWNEVVETPD